RRGANAVGHRVRPDRRPQGRDYHRQGPGGAEQLQRLRDDPDERDAGDRGPHRSQHRVAGRRGGAGDATHRARRRERGLCPDPEAHPAAPDREGRLTDGRRWSRRAAGFTLVEVLVVIVVVGILAAIAVTKIRSVKGDAYMATMKSDLRNLMAAEVVYFSE